MKIICELYPRGNFFAPVKAVEIESENFGAFSDNPFPCSEPRSCQLLNHCLFVIYQPVEAHGDIGSYPDPEEKLWGAAA